jgi:gamma-glutamylputrescine oxidase
VATLGALQGEINCDVCIIGGGFTGLSAALALSQNGYSVTLIESQGLAAAATGKNGGHLIRGYNHSPKALAARSDPKTAKLMCDLAMEAQQLIIGRIAQYKIDCDLKFGHVTAAMNDDHISDLESDIDEWSAIGYDDLKLLDEDTVQSFVKNEKYVGGMYDPQGAHFHPLNYALGLADAAVAAGCKIYDKTPALSIEPGNPARVITPQGAVKAKFVVLGGYVALKGVEKINRKVIAATAHMIATEPLGENLARKILPQNVAVTDANFVMNYFRLSNDNRLLFGGNCNYSGLDYPGQSNLLKKRMLDVFPELAAAAIDYCWGGPLDITLNRMPHFGRLAPNIFYAHGYCGHGIILSNMAGQLMAEAVRGTAERFDIFTKIKHAPFIGGDTLKRPLFVLGMMWYRLRDLLS